MCNNDYNKIFQTFFNYIQYCAEYIKQGSISLTINKNDNNENLIFFKITG